MASQIIAVRDAVVAALNAAAEVDGAFVLPFTAAAKRVVNLQLAEGFTGVEVPVVATGVVSSDADRQTQIDVVQIEVGVVKRLDRATAAVDDFAEADTLVELLEQLRDALRADAVDGWRLDNKSAEVAPLYDHERLLKDSLFVGVVKMFYQVQYPDDYGA